MLKNYLVLLASRRNCNSLKVTLKTFVRILWTFSTKEEPTWMIFLNLKGEWPDGLRCCNRNRKMSGLKPARCSTRPRDPTSLRGSQWPSGLNLNKWQWLTSGEWGWTLGSQIADKKNLLSLLSKKNQVYSYCFNVCSSFKCFKLGFCLYQNHVIIISGCFDKVIRTNSMWKQVQLLVFKCLCVSLYWQKKVLLNYIKIEKSCSGK